MLVQEIALSLLEMEADEEKNQERKTVLYPGFLLHSPGSCHALPSADEGGSREGTVSYVSAALAVVISETCSL